MEKYRFVSKLLIFLTLILTIITEIKTEKRQKISDVNVLLPICLSSPCGSVSYRITAYGGCYEWSTDKTSSLNVKTIQDEDTIERCYSSVIVSTKGDDILNKESVWLIARDKKSNEEFRCKIGFATVKSIRIAKRFDHMNVGEIVELTAIAYDQFNNTFSSLEGFKFNWRMNLEKNNLVPSAQILKLKEEKKEASEIRLNIEEEFLSDIVLLRGIKTGRVEITAELRELGYENVDTLPMTLYVLEQFNLIPPELYLHKGISYRMKIQISGRDNKVHVDYNNYDWSLPDRDCGNVDLNGNYMSERECNTIISAADKRIDKFNIATAKIHNVLPTKLDLGLLEIENFDRNNYRFSDFDKSYNSFSFTTQWDLVTDKYYVIKNFLFYENNVINDENDKIKYFIGNGDYQKFFEEIECNREKKFCIIKALSLREENFEINSEVEGKKFPVKKFVKIFSKVEINKYGKNKFILPYLGYNNEGDDSTLKSQELKLNVKGGTGRYIYYSSNTNIINIKNEVIYGNHVGSTIVKVTDSRIPTNYDIIQIDVEEIFDLSYIEERQEIEKNNNFDILVDAVTSRGERFTNCSSLPIFEQSDFTNEEKININDNYSSIAQFIKENNELLSRKYSTRKDHEYLQYSNYGVCLINKFKAQFEGLKKAKYFSKLILDVVNNQDSRIYSSKFAQILIFDKLYVESPIFTDSFTNKLLNKGVGKTGQNTFLITKDAQIDLKLSGGVSRWKEDPTDYIEIVQYRETKPFTVSNNSFQSVNNKLQNIKSQLDKNLIFICKQTDVNNDVEIKYTIRNKESTTLLRPKTTDVTIYLACSFPHSLSIFLLDDTIYNLEKHAEKRVVDIFTVEQRRSIDYYVKKQGTERFRVYAFDSYKRMFFNITNLKGHWEVEYDKHNLSENQLNRIKQMIVGKSKIYTNPEFVHRKIKFSDFNAVFTLTYRIEKILSQEIIINLLDLPVIEPETATLFLTDNNFITLSIKNGSGEFDVSYSDFEIANSHFIKNENSIKVYPKKKGILQVTARDDKLNGVLTRGNVFISKISAIKLSSDTLVQINTENKLSLRVFDEFKNIFSSDQIVKMRLQIEATNPKGLEFTLSNGYIISNEITVKGLVADDYYIKVFDPVSRISSNTLKLIVFDKLEIFPSYLLLLPGTTYMLNIRGGPRDFINIAKKYKIDDTSIAVVKENEPEITAINLGETVLRVVLELTSTNEDQNKSTVLCSEEIKVIVAIPDSIEIHNAYNRKIYINSVIRLLAFLKNGQRIFSLGNAKIDYDWQIDPPTTAQLITTTPELTCDQNKYDYCNAKDVSISNNVGMFLTAINKGTVEVRLKATVNLPDAFSRMRNVFEKKEKMIIDEKLDVEVPFFNGDKGHSLLYFVPPDIEHDLKTNKDPNFTRFTLLQKTPIDRNELVLELSENGRIKTSSKLGMAQILIERREKEDMPFTPLVLTVSVSNFYSLYVDRSYSLLDMEISQKYRLNIKIQHEYGMIFAEKYNNLPLRVVESNPSIVKTELSDQNSVLNISAQNKGETNVILYCPITKKIYDIIKVSVFTSFHFPEKIIMNIGGVIDFLSKNLNKKKYLMHDAEWKIEDPSIIRIDNSTGLFKAIGEGKTRVHLLSKDKSKAKLSTWVYVGRIRKITVTSSPELITPIKSHPNYSSEYRISFKSFIDDQYELSNSDDYNTIDQKLNIKCVSTNPNIFTTSLEEKKFNGKIVPDEKECVIKLREVKYDLKIPKNIEVEIVTESQGDRPQDKLTFKTKHEIPYVEPFRISNDLKEINFSKNNRTVTLELTNLNDLEILSDEPKYVKFLKEADNKVRVSVPQDISDSFKDIRLTFYNKLSSQAENIYINFDSKEVETQKTTILGLNRSTLVDLLSLLVLIAVIVLLFKAFLDYRPQETMFHQQPGYSMDRSASGHHPRGSSIKSQNLTYQ